MVTFYNLEILGVKRNIELKLKIVFCEYFNKAYSVFDIFL